MAGLLCGTFLFSVVVMGTYFFRDPAGAEPVVLSAWFGSSVVQTTGLLAIITRSLFPDRSAAGESLPESRP